MNFNEHFRLLSESCQRVEEDKARLIESVIELNHVQKENQNKQRELNDIETEIAKLGATNKDLKLTLMKALVERDELIIKRSDLAEAIDKLQHQLDIMEKESDELLNADHVNHVCNRYSIGAQVSIMNKIQDTKNKLSKDGAPFAFFL